MNVTPDIDEGQKQALISNIQEVDRRSFYKWIEGPQNQRRLDLPKSALRHLLISQRVLELAEDPAQVGIVVGGQTANTVDTYVIEHRPFPISDSGNLERYIQERNKYREDYKSKARARGVSGLFIVPEEGGPILPTDIDSYHVQYYRLVKAGLIGLNDYIINRISLGNNRHPELLFVGDYSDRDELRGKGIASSFYANLRQVVIEMGFSCLAGFNNPRNVDFFKSKLGRSTLGEVKPELRIFFMDNPSKTDLVNMTIDFLDANLKTKFLDIPHQGLEPK